MFVIAGRVLDTPSRHLSGAIIRNLRIYARKTFLFFSRGDFAREWRAFAGCRNAAEQAFMRLQRRGGYYFPRRSQVLRNSTSSKKGSGKADGHSHCCLATIGPIASHGHQLLYPMFPAACQDERRLYFPGGQGKETAPATFHKNKESRWGGRIFSSPVCRSPFSETPSGCWRAFRHASNRQ